MARAGEDTVIIIRDNGVGIEPGKLAELQGRLTRRSGKLWTHGERIGLSNVASRIHLHFGNSYGIRVESTEGQGTTVTVTIPL
ncbi:Histidine kinase-, DNA gyrase B-, and HSP90-like ATPase [compost metagenome]